MNLNNMKYFEINYEHKGWMSTFPNFFQVYAEDREDAIKQAKEELGELDIFDVREIDDNN